LVVGGRSACPGGKKKKVERTGGKRGEGMRLLSNNGERVRKSSPFSSINVGPRGESTMKEERGEDLSPL